MSEYEQRTEEEVTDEQMADAVEDVEGPEDVGREQDDESESGE